MESSCRFFLLNCCYLRLTNCSNCLRASRPLVVFKDGFRSRQYWYVSAE
jgi:hypothetical protein